MSTYEFTEITDGCIDGDGVFDEMMRSVKAHLKEEYDSQRIRGSEYTQVYLGALQSAMGQSIQWHLQAEINKNQALLIEKQIIGQDKQNLLLEEQRLQIIAQTALVTEQTLTQVQQTALATEQVVNTIAEGLNIPKQGEMIDAQIDNIGYQDQKLIQETAVVSEQAKQAIFTTLTIQPNQNLKLESEIDILDQKFVTEESQTKTVTSQGTLAGILGAQRDLYIKQTDGFDRDAEQKASRILTDIWGVSASTTDGIPVPPSAGSTQLDITLNELKTNAGIS